MDRAYLSLPALEVRQTSDSALFGQLARRLPFALEPTQSAAWEYQIRHLRSLAELLPAAYFCLEFLIPRMGRRADLIVLNAGIVFVVEYKLGARQFDRSSLDQVYGYGLDLKHFHEESHDKPIVPVLLATHAGAAPAETPLWDHDRLARPLKSSTDDLVTLIQQLSVRYASAPIDPAIWIAGRYRPTPTIVEAAQALYRGHDVDEISRSEAGAQNLTRTADYVAQAIETAKREHRKIICFITGVPGSGKTLAGLNLATARQRAHSDEHAVFLSGNGPLVEVLREALTLDAIAKKKEAGDSTTRAAEYRQACAFIQNIHHFRDEALASIRAPIEKVAVFDEAQRAWNVEKASSFMRERGHPDFDQSEPAFLLSVMDRHPDWCAIVCLVGGGQEINTGEAGIEEWLRALEKSFPHWQVHFPETLTHGCQLADEVLAPDLHLATSIRSFRAEKLSNFVGHVIDGNAAAAQRVHAELPNYPLFITRDLALARRWLRSQRRGTESAGLLASSNAARLKPHGVFVKAKIEPAKWFLAPADDVRSSDALEDAATEFDVQGLELDWACLCWDANLRRGGDSWEKLRFRGTRWESISDPTNQAYLANAYRVLLTRARQGLVVFIPEGDEADATRPPGVYDAIYAFLRSCGFSRLLCA